MGFAGEVVPMKFHLVLKSIQNLQKVKNYWVSSNRIKKKRQKM